MSNSTETPHREIERLRFEARLAFLDGRTAQAKKLNKRADLLAKEARL